jgi:iron complex outermembrane receptor protein
LVRKRYPGDYNHAVLSSRASGTGNSARSMVFADGILLSNFLGNGAGFTPRWGLVAPEEIERVDVLYGPFSAAYPGNSVGAVVDHVTRLPQRFEAHVKIGVFVQPFDLYGRAETFGGHQASASLGDRNGAFSWWLSLARLDSEGQPLTFPTKLKGSTPAGSATPVTGAVLDQDRSGAPWYLLGSGTRYDTAQDTGKLKLAYELTPGLRAQATLGLWRNDAVGQSESWLKDAAGNTVYSGPVAIDGNAYTVAASDFNQTRDALEHRLLGLSMKQHADGGLGWELVGSAYGYAKDTSRTPTGAKPTADLGGAGRITTLDGTGWTTLGARVQWQGLADHRIEAGLQRDTYRWRQRLDNAADWIGGEPTTAVSSFTGNTRLSSVYLQDAWAFAPDWTVVLGARHEHWQAFGGRKTGAADGAVDFRDRSEGWTSPKAAIGWQAGDAWSIKLATGRAVRTPTVGELFQGRGVAADLSTNPDLKPEKSWTSELSAEHAQGRDRWRVTLFQETTTDALYSQTSTVGSTQVTSVQNIERIRTCGLETALDRHDVLVKGLDVLASWTYADSTIRENSGYVATPGDTLGRQQPRVPRLRASVAATWRASDTLSASYGLRYGSRQYGTLNNSDPNGFTYQGFSKYFTTDARAVWKFMPQWTAAIGIDNLNNYQYWNFHPYPQRTYSAELRFDL